MCRQSEETPWWVFAGCVGAGLFLGLVIGAKMTIRTAIDHGAARWTTDKYGDKTLEWKALTDQPAQEAGDG